jgi:hypothetical protein
MRRAGAFMLETKDAWIAVRRDMALETLARVTETHAIRLPAETA